MAVREKPMGRVVRFLLPSLKLKQAARGDTTEQRVHTFFTENFGGYTAASGNIFGYWKDQKGEDSYGEHREFTVTAADDAQLDAIRHFIANVATEMGEECIFVEIGGQASLIYADAETR